jgi:hypothetical protein
LGSIIISPEANHANPFLPSPDKFSITKAVVSMYHHLAEIFSIEPILLPVYAMMLHETFTRGERSAEKAATLAEKRAASDSANAMHALFGDLSFLSFRECFLDTNVMWLITK